MNRPANPSLAWEVTVSRISAFLGDGRGTISIEYIVIGALVAMFLLAILNTIFQNLQGKLRAVNSNL
jgi:Flp pilus assembly pilin Flp